MIVTKIDDILHPESVKLSGIQAAAAADLEKRDCVIAGLLAITDEEIDRRLELEAQKREDDVQVIPLTPGQYYFNVTQPTGYPDGDFRVDYLHGVGFAMDLDDGISRSMVEESCRCLLRTRAVSTTTARDHKIALVGNVPDAVYETFQGRGQDDADDSEHDYPEQCSIDDVC